MSNLCSNQSCISNYYRLTLFSYIAFSCLLVDCSPSPTQLPNCFTGTSGNYSAILTGISGWYYSSGLQALGAGGTTFFTGTCAGFTLGAYSQHRYAIDLGGNTPTGFVSASLRITTTYTICCCGCLY